MPRVPRTSGPQLQRQVQSNPLSDPRATFFGAQIPAAAQGQGRQAQAAGRAANDLTNLAIGIAKEEFDRANESAVTEAYNQALNVAEDEKNRQFQRRGKDAFSSATDGIRNIGDSIQGIRNGLNNRAQRRMFDSMMSGVLGSSYRKLASHSAGQRFKFDQEELTSLVANQKRVYLDAATDGERAKALDLALVAAKKLGSHLSEEGMKRLLRETEGEFALDLAKKAAYSDDYELAENLMEKHAGAIPVSEREALRRGIKDRKTAVAADETAEALVAKHKNTADVLEAKKKVKPPPGVDPEKFESKLKQAVDNHLDEKKRIDDDRRFRAGQTAFQQWIDGGRRNPESKKSGIDPEVWAKLDPDQRQKLRNMWRTEARFRKAMSAGRTRPVTEHDGRQLINIDSMSPPEQRANKEEVIGYIYNIQDPDLRKKALERFQRVVRQPGLKRSAGDPMGAFLGVMKDRGYIEEKVKGIGDLKDDKTKGRMALYYRSFLDYLEGLEESDRQKLLRGKVKQLADEYFESTIVIDGEEVPFEVVHKKPDLLEGKEAAIGSREFPTFTASTSIPDTSPIAPPLQSGTQEQSIKTTLDPIDVEIFNVEQEWGIRLTREQARQTLGFRELRNREGINRATKIIVDLKARRGKRVEIDKRARRIRESQRSIPLFMLPGTL